MTREEKKKKAIAIAVSYYLEQERAELMNMAPNKLNSWSRMGQMLNMSKRRVIQSHGKLLQGR